MRQWFMCMMLSMLPCVVGGESNDDGHEESRAMVMTSSPQQKAALLIPGILAGIVITLLGERGKKSVQVRSESGATAPHVPIQISPTSRLPRLEPVDEFVGKLNEEFVKWFETTWGTDANGKVVTTLAQWLALKTDAERCRIQCEIKNSIEPAFKEAYDSGSRFGCYRYSRIDSMMLGFLFPR